MFAPAGRITARASRLCRLAALVVRRQALAPWNPKYVGRGRTGLKNRQDTFFDAPPTRSRLTAPPKKGFPLWGKLSPQVTDEGETPGYSPLIRRAGRATFPQRGKAFSVKNRVRFADTPYLNSQL